MSNNLLGRRVLSFWSAQTFSSLSILNRKVRLAKSVDNGMTGLSKVLAFRKLKSLNC